MILKFCEVFQRDSLKLALIQWYDFKSEKTPYKYECTYIKLTEIFNIVNIEAIYDIVHIIPHFDKENEYLVNKFIF